MAGTIISTAHKDLQSMQPNLSKNESLRSGGIWRLCFACLRNLFKSASSSNDDLRHDLKTRKENLRSQMSVLKSISLHNQSPLQLTLDFDNLDCSLNDLNQLIKNFKAAKTNLENSDYAYEKKRFFEGGEKRKEIKPIKKYMKNMEKNIKKIRSLEAKLLTKTGSLAELPTKSALKTSSLIACTEIERNLIKNLRDDLDEEIMSSFFDQIESLRHLNFSAKESDISKNKLIYFCNNVEETTLLNLNSLLKKFTVNTENSVSTNLIAINDNAKTLTKALDKYRYLGFLSKGIHIKTQLSQYQIKKGFLFDFCERCSLLRQQVITSKVSWADQNNDENDESLDQLRQIAYIPATGRMRKTSE